MVECKFLETLSLRTLVSPVTKDDFRTRYWEQKPLVVHRANPGFYGDLFTLRDFNEAIALQPSYVKTANAETKKNVSFKTNWRRDWRPRSTRCARAPHWSLITSTTTIPSWVCCAA